MPHFRRWLKTENRICVCLMGTMVRLATTFVVGVRTAIFNRLRLRLRQQRALPVKADVLKAFDEAVEKNRRLVEQNRKLMEQVNTLRQKLAAQPPVSRSRATVLSNCRNLLAGALRQSSPIVHSIEHK